MSKCYAVCRSDPKPTESRVGGSDLEKVGNFTE